MIFFIQEKTTRSRWPTQEGGETAMPKVLVGDSHGSGNERNIGRGTGALNIGKILRWLTSQVGVLAIAVMLALTAGFVFQWQPIVGFKTSTAYIVIRDRPNALFDVSIDPSAWILRTMTFNLRYASLNDGANRWEARRDHVADIINRYRPIILGTQEGLEEQLVDLSARLVLPYHRFGEPRATNDEHVQIFYDSTRVVRLKSGTFWLSATMQPETRGWDASHPRIATWARFLELRTAQEFVVINTQLDNVGVLARQEGIKLIWREMMKYATVPMLLLGDFNTVRSTTLHEFLTNDQKGPRFAEAWMVADRVFGNISNSYHGFIGPQYDRSFHPDWIPPTIDFPIVPGGNHIDWILVRPETRVLVTEVITEARDGRYPSDHYPVYAEIAMTPLAASTQQNEP